MDLKEITVKCERCERTLVWPLSGFKFNLIGAIQMQCKKCDRIAGIQPFGTKILGLKDEGQEDLIGRLLEDDESTEASTTK